ncbi:transposase, partial [Shigella boydii]
SGAGRTSDGNGSHASTLKSPSYTKSVSWQHYLTLLVMLCRAKCCSFPETAGQRNAGPVLCKTDHSPMVPLRLH